MPDITFLPDGKRIQVRPGTSLLDASRRARVAIATRCGGNASCLMCKVIVDDQTHLAPPSTQERMKLGELIDEGMRLSCQAKAGDRDLVVRVPENPLKAAVRALLEKQKEGEGDAW